MGKKNKKNKNKAIQIVLPDGPKEKVMKNSSNNNSSSNNNKNNNKNNHKTKDRNKNNNHKLVTAHKSGTGTGSSSSSKIKIDKIKKMNNNNNNNNNSNNNNDNKNQKKTVKKKKSEGSSSIINRMMNGKVVNNNNNNNINISAEIQAVALIDNGKKKEMNNDLKGAIIDYRRSIEMDPTFVEPFLHLAKCLKAEATCQQDLVNVENTYEQAIDVADEYDREEQHATSALQLLTLLLCQEGRNMEAKRALLACGFQYRLSRQVLHYPFSLADVACDNKKAKLKSLMESKRYCAAVDNALPQDMFHHMLRTFGEESSFWKEHEYLDPKTGYFSYLHTLNHNNNNNHHHNHHSHSQNSMESIVKYIHSIVVKHFPKAKEATKAEWWAHCRPHSSGHQLHFDSADEGIGGVKNPFVSTVVYLTEGVGGPTFVSNQLLNGKFADKGWLVHPAVNRMVMFDGTVLHGVIPGRSVTQIPGGRRITFMCAFWKDIEAQPRDDGKWGASVPFPTDITHSIYSWPKLHTVEFEKRKDEEESIMRQVPPIPISTVWECIDADTVTPVENLKTLPAYDVCFQGF